MFVIGRVVVALGLAEIVDGVAIGNDVAVKLPIAAEDVAEEHVAGAGGGFVDAVVGAHDGVGVAFSDGGAEGGQVGVPEVVLGGIDVGLVARGLGAAVNGVVLGCGNSAELLRVVALDAFDEGGAEGGG